MNKNTCNLLGVIMSTLRLSKILANHTKGWLNKTISHRKFMVVGVAQVRFLSLYLYWVIVLVYGINVTFDRIYILRKTHLEEQSQFPPKK